MSVTMGIDVGTTWCRACVLDGRTAHEVAVPSAVALDPHDNLVTGADAVAMATRFPNRAVFSATRLLGRKLHSPEVTWLAGASPVELVPSDNGDAWVRLGSERYSPEELVAALLSRVVILGEQRANKTIERVVLAAPATFDIPQHHALMSAADLAGLRVLRVVESAAAAVYAMQLPERVQTVVMADIGGGYFDVCVVRRRPAGWSVLGADGDPMLGGDDFDRRVVDAFIDGFFDSHGADLTKSPAALHRLHMRARDVRHRAASGHDAGRTVLPDIAEVDDRELALEHRELSISDLGLLWHEELQSFWPPCTRLFENLGLGTEDVDALFAIGGASKLPMVGAAITELFRKSPERPAGADLLAARGAAALAAHVGGGEKVLRSCFPHTLSVKVGEGRVSRVSSRNALLPIAAGRLFAAVAPGHETLTFEVYQGDAALARDNRYIARFVVHVVAGERHYLKFEVNTCGQLGVEATAAASGRGVPVEARFSSGLPPDDWAAIAARLSRMVPPHPAQRDGLDEAVTQAVPRRDDAPTPLMPITAVPDADTQPGDSKPTSSSRRRRPPTYDTRARASDAQARTLPARGTHADRGSTPSGPSSTSTIEGHSIVGTTVSDRYVITDVIAEGGMGRVYRATHKILDREYAVKVIHPELASSQTLVRRFLREAQAAARIKSEHVVEILDFGELPDGTSYFVMEYLDGLSLEQVLDDGVMPIADLLSVATQMARGLSAAHQLEIVHRDLKPANILLIPSGKQALVKILDFGIAKIPTSDGEGLTLVNSIVGTPHYMAPEQVHGEVDNRADIYAMGVVIYEMLTRHPPFDDESLALLLAKHRVEPPPRPRDVVGRRCPVALETLVLRCLEKDKEARFQTADELVAALEAVSADLPC